MITLQLSGLFMTMITFISVLWSLMNITKILQTVPGTEIRFNSWSQMPNETLRLRSITMLLGELRKLWVGRLCLKRQDQAALKLWSLGMLKQSGRPMKSNFQKNQWNSMLSLGVLSLDLGWQLMMATKILLGKRDGGGSGLTPSSLVRVQSKPL